jgi:hypothetical protein
MNNESRDQHQGQTRGSPPGANPDIERLILSKTGTDTGFHIVYGNALYMSRPLFGGCLATLCHRRPLADGEGRPSLSALSGGGKGCVSRSNSTRGLWGQGRFLLEL